MKAKSHIAMLTASCLLVSMLFGGAASADSVTVTADRLNIRKDADAASRIVGTVDEGETLSFIAESGDWYQVTDGEDTGFVMKEYVTLDNAKMEEDVKANTEAFAAPQTGKNSFRLNMRVLPTTQSSVVTILSEGTTLKITGQCGVWYQAEANGKTGYVMKQYVITGNDEAVTAPSNPGESGDNSASGQSGYAVVDVKLRTAPSTSSEVAGVIGSDDKVTILGEDGSWYKVLYNGREGYAMKEYISAAENGSTENNGGNTGNSVPENNPSDLIVYASAKNGVATERVNMRKEPMTGASIIMVVDENKSVSVTGETDGWYKVTVNGREGYIAKNWVAVNTTVYDSAKTGTTTEEVNLRADASTGSAVVTVVKGGKTVSVTANVDGWYKVRVDGLTGYILSDYVRLGGAADNNTNTDTDAGDAVVPENFVSYPAARSGRTTGEVNLRQEASTASKVVSVLSENTSLSLLGEMGEFYQVKSGSLFGYVAKAYVTLGAGNTSTDVNVGTGDETPAVIDRLYDTQKNGVTTVRVNMRRTPEGDVLFTLPAGTRVTMIGEAGSWYKVGYSNSTGYIARDYVTEEVVVPSEPEPDTDTEVNEAPDVSGEGTKAYITANSLNMRRSAGTEGSIIKVLTKGEEIRWYSLKDGWYLIKAGEDVGYISSKYVSDTKPEVAPETETAPENSAPQPATGKVQMADWFKSDISKTFAVGDIVTVTDVETGLSWQVKRSGGYNHADVQPLTAADTAKMKQAYGGTWSWNRRAIWVTVDGVRYAASMNGMPHGTGSITTNNFDGHHCIHFLNSRTHTGNRWDTAHQNMVQKAFKAGQ